MASRPARAPPRRCPASPCWIRADGTTSFRSPAYDQTFVRVRPSNPSSTNQPTHNSARARHHRACWFCGGSPSSPAAACDVRRARSLCVLVCACGRGDGWVPGNVVDGAIGMIAWTRDRPRLAVWRQQPNGAPPVVNRARSDSRFSRPREQHEAIKAITGTAKKGNFRGKGVPSPSICRPRSSVVAAMRGLRRQAHAASRANNARHGRLERARSATMARESSVRVGMAIAPCDRRRGGVVVAAVMRCLRRHDARTEWRRGRSASLASSARDNPTTMDYGGGRGAVRLTPAQKRRIKLWDVLGSSRNSR